MNKSAQKIATRLVPLAMVMLPGIVLAQSSVTLYGTVDVLVRAVKNDGSQKRLSMDSGGVNSGQIGFRGVEDLGSGYKAGFTLTTDLFADSGSLSAAFFNRQSTLSVFSPYGELRMGRDYTPSYWNDTLFDPFGTVGLGGSTGLERFGSAQPTSVRANNSIGYFLPGTLAGIYGQAMVAAGEGSPGNNGKYLGARLGYAAGRVDIAAALARQDVAAATGGYKTFNVAGSYNFGFAKLMAQFARESLQTTATLQPVERRFLLGAVVPFGQAEAHASWVRSDLVDSADDANKFSLGYLYNLSKRTALYTTAARIYNKGSAQFTLGSISTAVGTQMGSATALPTPGGKSSGIEFGIRHFF